MSTTPSGPIFTRAEKIAISALAATLLGVAIMAALPEGCVTHPYDTTKAKISTAIHKMKTKRTETAAIPASAKAPPFAEQAFNCSEAMVLHVNLETGRSGKTDVAVIPLHGGAATLLVDGIDTDSTSGWCYEGDTPITNGRMDQIRNGLRIRLANPRDEEVTTIVAFDGLRIRCDASGLVTNCFAG